MRLKSVTNSCESFTRCEEFVQIIHMCEKIRSVNIKVQHSTFISLNCCCLFFFLFFFCVCVFLFFVVVVFFLFCFCFVFCCCFFFLFFFFFFFCCLVLFFVLFCFRFFFFFFFFFFFVVFAFVFVLFFVVVVLIFYKVKCFKSFSTNLNFLCFADNYISVIVQAENVLNAGLQLFQIWDIEFPLWRHWFVNIRQIQAMQKQHL